jgi:hypothetical protein
MVADAPASAIFLFLLFFGMAMRYPLLWATRADTRVLYDASRVGAKVVGGFLPAS